MEPKVSVIVPVYKVEKYLCRCVDALLNQTLKDTEIILVDDGSPDGSPEICNRYKEKDKRIKVIHKLNGGLPDARNAGLKIAAGEFISFIDSDDWCEKDMLEKLYKRAKEDSSDVSVCSYIIDYTNNNFSVSKILETAKHCTHDISEAIYILDSVGMFNVVWNKLYRREILINNNLSFALDGVPGEDLLFNCSVFKIINKVSFVDKILYHYMREDEETLVTNYRPNLLSQVRRFNKARKEMYDLYCMTTDKYIKCYANTFVAYIFNCIPNLYRNNADLNWSKKSIFFGNLFKDQEIKMYMGLFTERGFHYNLFKFIYNLGNPLAANLIYSIMFIFRYKFKGKYRLLRKKIFFKQ